MQQLTTEPALPHLKATGAAASQRAVYLEWCQREGVAPDPRIVG